MQFNVHVLIFTSVLIKKFITLLLDYQNNAWDSYQDENECHEKNTLPIYDIYHSDPSDLVTLITTIA